MYLIAYKYDAFFENNQMSMHPNTDVERVEVDKITEEYLIEFCGKISERLKESLEGLNPTGAKIKTITVRVLAFSKFD